jgi:opacity protein-like surface antigen
LSRRLKVQINKNQKIKINETLVSIFLFLASSVLVYAQQSMITLSGGYAFADVEDADADATGWRINALYEFAPVDQKVIHGVSFGYIGLSAEGSAALDNSTYEIGTFPIYYAPKFMVGNDDLKGFAKAAVGWQFSDIKRTGTALEAKSNDAGFTLGAGAGASYFLTEKVFLTAEYEFLWLQNSFFRDGYLSTVAAGLGIKF